MRKFFIFLFFPYLATAQYTPPGFSEIYNDKDIPILTITIDPEYLNIILEPGNEKSDEEFYADIRFQSSSLDVTEKGVGFRLRGNTSRYSAKKSFKIAINSFEKGRKLDGFEKMNINGEHNDPSIIRSKVCWDIMNELRLPAPRANHVELYVNEEYRGLYISVEHIDEEFIEKRFGNKTGNLYKCLWPADLTYKGEDPDIYKEMHGDRRIYELKINEEIDDYSGLANFIKILNETPYLEFQEEISKIFDVTSYLKILAVEILTGHWDNYSINQNNYYLYENPDDGKFYYIPYDMDNTLGIDWINGDWAEHDIYKWYEGSSTRPLTFRILNVPAYREEFTRIMARILEDHFSEDRLFPRIDELKAMIRPSAEQDLYRTYDYGFTMDEFDRSYTEALDAGHVRFGLKEFILLRRESAFRQLDEVIYAISANKASEVSIYPNPITDRLYIRNNAPNTTLSFFTMSGEKVWEEALQGNEVYPPIKKGIYLLVIDSPFADRQSKRVIFR